MIIDTIELINHHARINLLIDLIVIDGNGHLPFMRNIETIANSVEAQNERSLAAIADVLEAVLKMELRLEKDRGEDRLARRVEELGMLAEWRAWQEMMGAHDA